MGGQLSPAWAHRPVSQERLARISARFLCDETPRKNGGDSASCRRIPFLLHDSTQRWITHDLCQVLNQRGHPSMLCHLDRPAPDPTGEKTGLPAAEHLRQSCDYCLLPFTSVEGLVASDPDHVVMLVPARLDAVRLGYQRIKHLQRSGRSIEIGVVIVGARDQHAAWRHFRKLAVGSLRYLDVPLLNLGFLPEQVAPDRDPSSQHRRNFLARISERLIRSEFHHQREETSRAAGEQP